MRKLGIPNLTNPYNACLPVSVLCGIRYLDKTCGLSLEQMMRLMRTKTHTGTYFEQAAWALHQLKIDFNLYASGSEKKQRAFARSRISFEAEKRNWNRIQHFTCANIRYALDNRDMVVIGTDHNLLLDKPGAVSRHAIILTGYEGDDFFYHDCGSSHFGIPARRHVRISERNLERARDLSNHTTLVFRGPPHAPIPKSSETPDRHTQQGQARRVAHAAGAVHP